MRDSDSMLASKTWIIVILADWIDNLFALYPTAIGSGSTITCWSPGHAALAKAMLRAHWPKKPFAMALQLSMSVLHVCFAIWPSLEPMAASQNSWTDSLASTS